MLKGIDQRKSMQQNTDELHREFGNDFLTSVQETRITIIDNIFM
jgi:hypothetical protein